MLPSRGPAGPRRSIAAATEAFLDAHISAGAWSPGTAVTYRQTLTALTTPRRGGPTRRASIHARPWPSWTPRPAGWTCGRRSTTRSARWPPPLGPRHLATLRSAIGWWRGRGWLHSDPTDGWARPKVVVDTTRALTRAQVDALWRRDVPPREKTLWRMLYETAARATEILNVDIEDLDLPNKRARVVGKGGATGWVHWQTGTAHLLPRLSYRRAAELFEAHTRRLAHPDAGADELVDLDG